MNDAMLTSTFYSFKIDGFSVIAAKEDCHVAMGPKIMMWHLTRVKCLHGTSATWQVPKQPCEQGRGQAKAEVAGVDGAIVEVPARSELSDGSGNGVQHRWRHLTTATAGNSDESKKTHRG
jgi:hypothetical protein